MPLPISLSDMLQRRAAGRSRLAWFRQAAMRTGGSIGDLRLRMWGEEGERAYLSVLLDDYVSPVNELRLEALIQGLWPVRSTDLAPTAIKNSAAWYAADRVENEVLLADDFDRADGALGSVPGPGDPVAWEVLSGTWAISGNKAALTSGGGGQASAVVESGTADCAISATFTTPADVYDPGLTFRVVDNSNYLLLSIYESGATNLCKLYKRDAGAFVELANFSTAYSATRSATFTPTVVVKGDKVSLFVDGVYKASHTLSAGDYTKYGASTRHGIRENASAKTTFDNFSVRTLNPSADLAAAVDTFSRSTAAEIIDLAGTRAGAANPGANTGTALRLPGTAGNEGVTPDSDAFNWSSSVRLDFQVSNLPDVAGPICIGGHASGSNHGLFVYVYPQAGAVRLFGGDGSTTWSTGNITNAGVVIGSATPKWVSVRATIGGTFTTFYSDDGENWVAAGTASGSALSGTVNPSGVSMKVGAIPYTSSSPFKGRIHKWRYYADGTVVASPDFTAQPAGTTSFADAQGNTWTINQSHGSIGSTETGEAAALAWSGNTPQFNLVNGKMQPNFASGVYVHVDAGLADMSVTVDMVPPSVAFSSFAMMCCFVDGNNYLYVDLTDAELRLRKVDAASFSTLATHTHGLTVRGTRHEMRTIKVGDRFWIYLNGALLLTHTLSGADFTKFGAATRHGVRAHPVTANTGTFDNFRISRPPLVACWPDLSGKHRHAVQTTLAKQPVLLTNIKNGRAVARFDGVDDVARTAAFAATLAQPNTVLLASASALSTGSTGIVDGHSTNTGRIYQTGTQLAAHAGAGLLTASTTITNWHTTAARFNGASSSIRLDGVEHSAGNAGAASTAGLTVGAHGGLAGFWPGDIGEIVAANADLDATGELEDAENYLMQRWT